MLIVNGTLVTMGNPNRLIPNGALYIREGRIVDLGPSSDLQARYGRQGEERIDARGQLVLPGIVCAHTHFYGVFSRGMSLPGEPAGNFTQILEKLWWRLDKALWPEDVHQSALVCLVDAIRHGTTTLLDHHASQGEIVGSLDQIASAVQQAGVRACLCYEVTDRDGPEAMRAGIAENLRFLWRVRNHEVGKDQRLAATFGLHASLTLSDETLEACVEAAKPLDTGFHIHVAEDKADVDDSLRKSGLRVVERLQKFGVLGPRTIAAHAVHVDRIETELLLDSGTMVVQNPRSNMNNAVGTPDLPWMLHIGIPVGLDTVLRMLWEHNPRIARTFFPGLGPDFGHLAAGAPADVIFVDYVPPTPLNAGNLPWHTIFGIDGTGVTTTIAGGKLLMRDRKLLTLDEGAIAARAQELAGKLWQRI